MDFVYEYSNVVDYFNKATGPREYEHSYNSSHQHDANWSGSDSYDETLQRYNKGYAHGTAQARELLLKITPYVRTVQSTRRGWSPQRYAGGNFILSNYVRGVPELCNVMSPIVSKKFASIVLNQTASAGIGADVMLKRGVCVVALVNLLEMHGYRCAVKVAYGERGSDHRLFTTVVLKAFNQTMELDRLAFFLADPSAFRRLNFSFMESLPANIIRDVIARSYGVPIELPASMIDEKDIYLSCANLNQEHWHSVDGTIAFLKETLKRYGIDLL